MAKDDFFGHTYAAWLQAMRESYGSPKPYMRQSWPGQPHTHPYTQTPILRQPHSLEPTERPQWMNTEAMVKGGTDLANQKVAETYGGPPQQPYPQTHTQTENVNWTRKPHMVHDRPLHANQVAAAAAGGGGAAAVVAGGYVYGNTWAQGLCGCTEDARICLCVCCCTPCAACQVAYDMGEFVCLPCCTTCPSPSCTFCLLGHPCPWFFAARSRVRTRLAIEGSMCEDCMVSTCCYPFGLCQLMREVKLAKAYGKM